MSAVVVAGDLVTAYGRGMDATWQGLLSGRSALAASERISFPSGSDRTPLGIVPGVDPRSAVLQMLEPMLRDLLPQVPADTLILLATTTGEIEYLEAATLKQPGAAPIEASDPSRLLEKLCVLCGLARGRILSAACASSTLAIAQAAALISSGAEESVLVIACDAVSEFVYAGFATMNALDPAGARPFDQDRQGLNLGEAAAIALLMSEGRAAREKRSVLGSIAGWAASNDASHITRPDTTGGQLARAIRQAMERAGVAPGQVDFISAHGTGTRYNDAMEMAAFQSLFSARPVFSVKGALGHTLGAAGLVEILISFRALSEHLVPPTIGLRQPEDCASGWATECPIPLDQSRVALTTNSGFGGINAALVLTRDFETNSDASAPPLSPPLSSGIGWITGTAYGLMRHGEIRADHRDNARIPGSVENGAPLKPFCDAAHSGQGSSFFKTQGGADAGLWDVAPSGLNLVPFGSVDALFRRKVERFGRFDPVSRMACLACELALQAAGYSPADRQEIGILGAGFEGSLAANAAYFKDYVESGRILARGNLFVYTLPTAALGEAAIHFGFQGPLFSLISRATPLADALEAASLLVKNGDAPAMLVVQAEAESAVAALVTADSAPLLSLLATLAASTPRLSQLIPLLAAHTKNPGQ